MEGTVMNFWVFLGWWILGAVTVYSLATDADIDPWWKEIISALWPLSLPLLGVVVGVVRLSQELKELRK
jgi:hypothetical protein